MAYRGETSMITCSKGGLTGARNIDDIPDYMMVYPSRNVNLEKNGRRKRGGTVHYLDDAIAGTPKILGLYHADFDDGSGGYILAATADGKIYAEQAGSVTEIASGMGTVSPFCMAMGEEKVFIADGVSVPKVWSGAGNVADVAEPAVDFSSNPIFQVMVHSKGASKRMLALNNKTLFFSKTYAAAGDMEYFQTGAESMVVETGDAYGLVGMAEFGEDVILFGRTKAYRVDDDDTDTSKWGYEPVQWEGGASHWRLIVKTPNDIVAMADDGEIYSVTAVTSYGDYKQASLTRGSWMHDYIKEYIRLGYIEHFHAEYDPSLRAIFFWVVRNGHTTIDQALVYFIDRDPAEAWMVHDNDAADSGYKAAAACQVKLLSGPYQIFTGDYAGMIWKLNQANRVDHESGYYGGFKTPNYSIGDPRLNKHFNSGRIVMIPTGNYKLTVKVWVDGDLAVTGESIDMTGGGAVLGRFVLGTDVLGGTDLIDSSFRIGRVGKRIQYEFFCAGANEDFFISGIMTDWKPVGKKQ